MALPYLETTQHRLIDSAAIRGLAPVSGYSEASTLLMFPSPNVHCRYEGKRGRRVGRNESCSRSIRGPTCRGECYFFNYFPAYCCDVSPHLSRMPSVMNDLINSVPPSVCDILTIPQQRYHQWMLDADLRELTASEPLSLDEEYAMQSALFIQGHLLFSLGRSS